MKPIMNLAMIKDPWIVAYAGSLDETYPALLWSRAPEGLRVPLASEDWEWLPEPWECRYAEQLLTGQSA